MFSAISRSAGANKWLHSYFACASSRLAGWKFPYSWHVKSRFYVCIHAQAAAKWAENLRSNKVAKSVGSPETAFSEVPTYRRSELQGHCCTRQHRFAGEFLRKYRFAHRAQFLHIRTNNPPPPPLIRIILRDSHSCRFSPCFCLPLAPPFHETCISAKCA